MLEDISYHFIWVFTFISVFLVWVWWPSGRKAKSKETHRTPLPRRGNLLFEIHHIVDPKQQFELLSVAGHLRHATLALPYERFQQLNKSMTNIHVTMGYSRRGDFPIQPMLTYLFDAPSETAAITFSIEMDYVLQMVCRLNVLRTKVGCRELHSQNTPDPMRPLCEKATLARTDGSATLRYVEFRFNVALADDDDEYHPRDLEELELDCASVGAAVLVDLYRVTQTLTTEYVVTLRRTGVPLAKVSQECEQLISYLKARHYKVKEHVDKAILSCDSNVQMDNGWLFTEHVPTQWINRAYILHQTHSVPFRHQRLWDTKEFGELLKLI